MKNRILSLILSILFLMQFTTVSVSAARVETRNPYILFNGKEIDNKKVSRAATFKLETKLAGLKAPDWVCYNNMDFGKDGPQRVRVVIANTSGVERSVIFTIDKSYSDGGKVIASVPTIGGGWSTQLEFSAPILEDVSGVHNVYLTFDVVAGQDCTADVYSIQFIGAGEGGSLPFYSETIDAYNDIADDPNRRSINMISDLGALRETATGAFLPNLPVSRGEFAYAVFKLYGIKDKKGAHQTSYTDVDPTAYYAQAVDYLTKAGIINGITEKEFHPTEFIRHIDATAILCRILDFGDKVNYFGGYPNGYLKVASEEKLLVNGLGANDVLRKTDMAALLHNALLAKCLEVNSIVNSNIVYEKKQGILYKTRHAYHAEGMVETNHVTNIYLPNSELKSNQVIIDGTVYEVGNTNASAYIGIDCEFFYTEADGKRTLILIQPMSSVEITAVSSRKDMIAEISDNGISYYKAGKTSREHFAIDGKTAVLYNGKAIHASLETITGSASEFNGTIRFVENNSGINTVLVEQYYSTVAQTVSTERMLIEDCSSPEKELNLNESVSVAYVLKNGELIELKDLSEGTVITVYESKNTSGKKVYRIIASDRIVSGMIETISDDEVTINGETYVISPSAVETFSIGQEGTFKLDINNEIVAYETGTQSDMSVALLLDSTTNASGLDSQTKLKLFTESGKEEVFTLAQDVQIDGIVLNNAADWVGLSAPELTDPTPVRYELNKNGEIKTLDTILTGDGGAEDVVLAISDKPNTYRWLSNVVSLSGKTIGVAYMPPTTKTFIGYYGSENETKWMVSTAKDSIKSTNSLGKTRLYSLTGDKRLCDVLVWNDPGGYASGFDNRDRNVFKKRAKTVDQDGSPAYMLTFVRDGVETDYIINETIYQNSPLLKNMRVGDVIRFRPLQNATNGFIANSVAPIFFRDAIGSELAPGTGTALVSKGTATNGTRTTTGSTYIYGNVVEKSENYIMIEPKDGTELTLVRRLGSVTRVKENGQDGNVTVESGLTTQDISIGDEVLACLSIGVTKSIIIYDISEGR